MRYNPIFLQYYCYRRTKRFQELADKISRAVRISGGLGLHVSCEMLCEAFEINYKEMRRKRILCKLVNDLRRLGVVEAYRYVKRDLQYISIHQSVNKYSDVLFKFKDDLAYIIRKGITSRDILRLYASTNPYVRRFFTEASSFTSISFDSIRSILVRAVREIHHDAEPHKILTLINVVQNDKGIKDKFLLPLCAMWGHGIKFENNTLYLEEIDLEDILLDKYRIFSIANFYKVVRTLYYKALKSLGYTFGEVPIKKIYDIGISEGMLPQDLDFNTFVEYCKQLSKVYSHVILHVHPRFVNRPDIGYAISIER